MSMKTNKSYSKRLKVTKNGKILARRTGQNHFNSKENHAQKISKSSRIEFHMSNKERSRFLVNL